MLYATLSPYDFITFTIKTLVFSCLIKCLSREIFLRTKTILKDVDAATGYLVDMKKYKCPDYRWHFVKITNVLLQLKY